MGGPSPKPYRRGFRSNPEGRHDLQHTTVGRGVYAKWGEGSSAKAGSAPAIAPGKHALEWGEGSSAKARHQSWKPDAKQMKNTVFYEFPASEEEFFRIWTHSRKKRRVLIRNLMTLERCPFLELFPPRRLYSVRPPHLAGPAPVPAPRHTVVMKVCLPTGFDLKARQ